MGTEGTHEGEEWAAEDGEPLATEQLALAGDEDRLPWLESADEDDYEEGDSASSGMMKLVGMGILALAVLVGAIWWATHRNPDPAMVADGSVVQADSQPYKEAPKNPGGKEFEGTGDSSFAVSEGQNRPAQLGGDKSVAPAPGAAAPAAAKPGAPAAAPAPAAASGGVGVQVGAFSSKEAAEAGWSKVVAQSHGALSGVSHRVIAGSADNGTIYRLQAVSGDAAAANALCGKLKSAGVSCQVK